MAENQIAGKKLNTKDMPESIMEPVRIVGIGASAGGLEALELFFDQMAEDNNFAFVVIMHLSPDYKSLMVEIISRRTRMNVREVEDGMILEPRTVYIIPRKKNMTLFHGKLFLTEQEKGLNLPIDILFRSLADEKKEDAVGIVLSGTGSDGTRGIRAIKEAGGMVMVQDIETAKFDGMPRSAISTGIVDYILSPEAMPEKLTQFVKGGFGDKQAENKLILAKSDDLTKVLSLIKSRTGVDFSFYKSNTVLRRIERRMGINQIDQVEEYVRFLEENPQEINILFKELLIGVTKFFRDQDAFDVLKVKVLPEIFNSLNQGEEFRAWVGGCSTGEEAYSLAILISEFCEENNFHNEIKIFATDIDREALQYAGYGIYPESIAADATRDRLSKYFIRKGDHYQIAPSIRKKVVFAYHNIIKDPPFRNMHLVSCRNLLIYLQPVLQKKVLSNFYFSLANGGFLVLGTSETIGEFNNYFSTFNSKWKIYQTKTGEKPRDIHIESSLDVPAEPIHSHYSRRKFDKKDTRVVDQIYKFVLKDFVPPSVLINEDKEVVYIFGEVDRYLKLPLGKIDTDISKLARSSITIPLGVALQKAMKNDKETQYTNIKIEDEQGEPFLLNITVKPQIVSDNKYYVIVFERESDLKADVDISQIRSCDISSDVKERIDDLENQLEVTKENLQSTIEELETSNEELQATNEELLASNEELQSTNEELQSVNEELITVNSEYQSKIKELTELNEDINNLLASTDIGTLFLDNKLTIRKYTPPAMEQINIIESDIGRPISHFSHNLEYDRFVDDIEQVLGRHKKMELEVQNKQGQWFLVKMLPYMSSGKKVTGVVISFVDITERKELEKGRIRDHNLLERVLEYNPMATITVDGEGRIVFVNRRAEELLELDRETLKRMTYNQNQFKATDSEGEDVSSEDMPFSIIARTQKHVSEYIHHYKTPGNGLKTLSINGTPMFDENGEVSGAVFVFKDVSNRKECTDAQQD